MKLLPSHCAVCTVALAASFVSAGTVEQATIVADPQMQVKDGAVQGCGYRLKGIPKSLVGQASVLVLDTSFNLYSSGLGLLKGGALQIQIRDGKAGPTTTKQIESFWLKAQSERPTTPLNGKVLPADTKGYLLYGETIESIGKLFAGIAERTPVAIGVRIKGESVDRIYSGVVQVSDQDKDHGDQCLGDLIRQLDAAPSPKPSSR